MSLTTIEVQVPSGKKVKMNPMEKGMLITFEQKNELELIQEHLGDLEYFRYKLYASSGIPKKYFGNAELESKIELQKCKDDKTRIYMIEKYFSIRDKQGIEVPFKLMDHQKLILKSFAENNGTIVKSYRQAGNSVLQQAYLATELILNDKINILFSSCNTHCSNDFIKGVRDFIEQYSKATGKDINIRINNNEGITLSSGATIKYINMRQDQSLYRFDIKNVTHIVYDTAAFIEFNNELLYKLDEKLPENVKVIIASTDKKEDNWFKRKWNSNNIYDLNKIELEWFDDPRFNKDLKWIKVKQEVKENGIEKVKQAYLPTNNWYIQMCKNFSNNKVRIEEEIGLGYNPNEDPIEVEKEDIREQIFQLNTKLKKLDNKYYN